MRYPGGKGKCFQHLINLIPPHETYIESHIGGGSVFKNKQLAERSIGIDKDPSVISYWQSQNIPSSRFVNDDAVDFLFGYKFTGNEFIYSDPPYLPNTRRRERVYKHDYSSLDHSNLLKLALQVPCMMMISGYDSELYNDTLSNWKKIIFNAQTHQGPRTECVWLNFSPPSQLHDSRYLGNTYRERQTIKRRQERLKARIQKMPSIERHELIRWLHQSYGER